jgi:hypothetical protein
MLAGTPAAIGELHHVCLAEIDHAGRREPARKRSRARRDSIAPGRGASHCDLALHEILDRDRDAVQRSDGVARANGLSAASPAATGGLPEIIWR